MFSPFLAKIANALSSTNTTTETERKKGEKGGGHCIDSGLVVIVRYHKTIQS